MRLSADQPGSRYYAAFDALRLIGAALVTLQHVLTLLRKDHHTYIGIVNMGQLGVALFMGISGFLAFQTRRPPAAWLGHRLLRIYPAYWIAIIASFLLAGLVEHKRFDAAQVISQLAGTGVFTHPDNLVNSPTWFISMLLVCYLGVFLIFAIARPGPASPARQSSPAHQSSPARQGEGHEPQHAAADFATSRARTLPGGACRDIGAAPPATLSGVLALFAALTFAVLLVFFPRMAVAPHVLSFAAAFALAALLPTRAGRAMLATGLLFLALAPWRSGFVYPALTLTAIAAALHLPAPPRLARTLAAYAYEYYLVHGVALYGFIHFLRPYPLIAAALGVLLSCVAAAVLRWLVNWVLLIVGIGGGSPAHKNVVQA